MIELIPAIDIIEGKCVRLTKGDYDSKRVYGRKYLDALARRGAGLVYGNGKQVDRGKEDFGAQGGSVRKD